MGFCLPFARTGDTLTFIKAFASGALPVVART